MSGEGATVAEVVGATLARLGVGHAFGVVGSGNFALVRALRAHGVPYTAARHEGGAATMADAYARVSGQLVFAGIDIDGGDPVHLPRDDLREPFAVADPAGEQHALNIVDFLLASAIASLPYSTKVRLIFYINFISK